MRDLLKIREETQLEIEEGLEKPVFCPEHAHTVQWACAVCGRALCSECKPIAYRKHIFCRSCIESADAVLEARRREAVPPGRRERIAGYRKRLLAFAVDCVLFLALLAMAVIAAYPVLAWMGPLSARFVAVTLFVLYFALFESAYGGGTPGKRWLQLAVVNAQGRRPALRQSFWRALLFSLPVMVFFTALPAFYSRLWGNYLWVCLNYAFALLLITGSGYLLLFNRRSKQLLHDWFSKSFVIRADAVARGAPASTPRKHLWAIGALAVLLSASGIWVGMELRTFYGPSIRHEDRIIERLKQSDRISHSRVYIATKGQGQNQQVQLVVSVWLRHKLVSEEGFNAYLKAIRQVLVGAQAIPKLDAVVIRAYYGVDVGFIRNYKAVTNRGTRAEWQRLVERANALGDLSPEQLEDYLGTLPWLK